MEDDATQQLLRFLDAEHVLEAFAEVGAWNRATLIAEVGN